jgi:hypothetical protein
MTDYSQEGNPHDVLQERTKESSMTQSIHENRIGKVTANREHKADTDPNLKTAKVVAIRGQLPAEQEIVEHSQDERCGDTIVRKHVRHHTELVVHRSAGPDKLVKLGGDGTLGEPLDKGVEDELGTTKCILFL